MRRQTEKNTGSLPPIRCEQRAVTTGVTNGTQKEYGYDGRPRHTSGHHFTQLQRPAPKRKPRSVGS